MKAERWLSLTVVDIAVILCHTFIVSGTILLSNEPTSIGRRTGLRLALQCHFGALKQSN